MGETSMKSIQWKIMNVLLGLLMLVAGLNKLFVFKAAGVSGMLGGIFLFAWAPMFWAYVLIFSEIIFGLLILFKWKLEYTTIPPMIILGVATLFSAIKWKDLATITHPVSYLNLFLGSGVIFHVLAIVGYWMLMSASKK